MAKEKKPGKQRRKGSDEQQSETLLSSLSTTEQIIKKIVHNFCEWDLTQNGGYFQRQASPTITKHSWTKQTRKVMAEEPNCKSIVDKLS